MDLVDMIIHHDFSKGIIAVGFLGRWLYLEIGSIWAGLGFLYDMADLTRNGNSPKIDIYLIAAIFIEAVVDLCKFSSEKTLGVGDIFQLDLGCLLIVFNGVVQVHIGQGTQISPTIYLSLIP